MLEKKSQIPLDMHIIRQIHFKIDKKREDLTMTVDQLTLEVTRRCNMNCAHCLRGDAQCLDMSKEVVDKVLQDIDYISFLFFTGGEPSLNIPIMDYFLSR